MSILDKKLEACRVCGETDTSGIYFNLFKLQLFFDFLNNLGKVGFHLNTVTCEACKVSSMSIFI